MPPPARARGAARRGRARPRRCVASTTRTPCASACSTTTSIAAAFSSTRYVSASTRSPRSASRFARFVETWTTSASRCETSRDARGEDRDPALERRGRTEPQLEVLDHDVGDQPPVGVQVVVAGLAAADDEDPAVDVDRRDRGTAAVEDDDVGAALGGERRARRDVRDEDRAGEAAARAPAADRRHAGERGDLEVVGRRVPPGARALDELVERRRRLDDLGLGRAAAAHRDDDDAPVAREEPREMRGHRGLPHALARCRSRRSTAARTARSGGGSNRKSAPT